MFSTGVASYNGETVTFRLDSEGKVASQLDKVPTASYAPNIGNYKNVNTITMDLVRQAAANVSFSQEKPGAYVATNTNSLEKLQQNVATSTEPKLG